jgi:saccharopine dehydrogenase-like NADP-dependent oxidoreductase
MRIVVLGGAGDMGSEAVRDLVNNQEVKEVIVADLNFEKAKELKKNLGEKIVPLSLDANNKENLIEVIKKGDVALSCIGPFYKFEAKIAKAAIEAGVNYVSICDDFDAVEEVLKLDQEAKNKNLTILTGMGWTPGISNVLALKGVKELKKADIINIAWAGDAEDSEGLAVIKHTYHIFTGMIITYLDGKHLKIKAGTGKEIVEFLPPINKIPVYHLGHPEPVTIPKFIPNVKTVTLKGGLTPPWLNGLAKILVSLKLTNTPEKRDRLANLTKKLLPYLPGGGLKISGLRVDVKGENGHCIYKIVDKMRRLTGIPASIGTVMLAKGEITTKGVIAPEACIEPERFIEELEKRNMKIVEEKIL